MIFGQAQIDRRNAASRQFVGGDAKGAERDIGAGIGGGQVVGALHRLIILFQRH